MSSISISSEVDQFIADSTHALAPCLQPLRELIHAANQDITEQIKWKSPSFCVDGDDRITYNLAKKDQLLLIFHTGAKGKGKTPDKSKFSSFTFLEWLAPDRAVVKIANQKYLADISSELKKCISQWSIETK